MPSRPRPRQRRSLSMPRTDGRVNSGGDRERAEPLIAALRAPQQEHEVSETLTHPFHSYPARLHPATARVLVEVLSAGTRGDSLIVDPFCGSGTTLVEIMAAGRRAAGTDLNPLAVLIARAKTWTAPGHRRGQLRDVAHELGGAVLDAGKAARRAGAAPPPMRKPVGFDPNARNRRLASWFSPHVRRELEMIAGQIDEMRVDDAELADVLFACLSAVLYKVSSRTSDTDKTWVNRNVPRGAATRHFVQRVELLVAGLADLSGGGDPPTIVEIDARRLHEVVPDGTATAVLTSPPYAGTYDYAEHQRLRFDFLGLRHRDFDAQEIGSRRSFVTSSLDAERAWREALSSSLQTIARVLVPGGRAAVVIGDSFAGGRAVYALNDLRASLPANLVAEAWASQTRPMLGAGELREFGDRPKAEHIVLLRRS